MSNVCRPSCSDWSPSHLIPISPHQRALYFSLKAPLALIKRVFSPPLLKPPLLSNMLPYHRCGAIFLPFLAYINSCGPQFFPTGIESAFLFCCHGLPPFRHFWTPQHYVAVGGDCVITTKSASRKHTIMKGHIGIFIQCGQVYVPKATESHVRRALRAPLLLYYWNAVCSWIRRQAVPARTPDSTC